MRVGNWNRAAVLLLAAALSGCATENINPVTGKRIYAPISASTEASSGRKAGDEIIAQYGVYQDPELAAYVDRVGQALAKNVVRKNVKYTFTILDDDGINAFALPGGYVYVTRGTLNFANSEAELAAILGHEIGHVDAFHFRRKERDTVSGVLSVLLRHSSTDADDLAMAQELAEKSTKSSAYSRENELEADALSIHYLALAGYDPQAMVVALHTEDAKSKLDDGGMKGNPVAHDIFAMDQSHPATPDREARAQEAVKATAAKNIVPAPASDAETAASPQLGATHKTDRDAYLAAIDGMAFGADPAEGTVEGRRVVNTVFGFSFEAPEGFDLWTDRDGVFGVGRNAVLILEAADGNLNKSMVTYVQTMMEKTTVDNVRPLDLDMYRGASGTVTMDPFVVRLAAIQDHDYNVYRLMYIAPRRALGDLDAGFVDSMKSFRPLKAGEAKPKPTPRIRIVTVASGDTVNSLAERMAVQEKKVEWFRMLNGLEAGAEVKAGDKVKVVE
jgi:predicted Zn-dependent protease